MLHNKGKSFLTMLGMIIGVSSVILIISLGAGGQSLITNQVESVGSNLIRILPGTADEEGRGTPAILAGAVSTALKYEDARAISDSTRVPNIIAATPYVRGSSVVTFEGTSRREMITGVSHEMPIVIDAEIAEGRFFSKDDEISMSRVIVIGKEVRDNFFAPEDNPIGLTFRLDKVNFKIIGVMAERGVVGLENQDEQIYIPAPTVQKVLLGVDYVGMILAKADAPENIKQAEEDIIAVISELHKIDEGENRDFIIGNQMDALAMLGTVTGAINFFLAAIAAISLIVGGVGIMNIMLVTVTERTREVGLRKAVGAKRQSILSQFLIEAILISLIGGLIGILIGASTSFLISLIVNFYGYTWDFVVSFNSIFLATSVSATIGIIFGFYPAYQASKLDPIQALRYE